MPSGAMASCAACGTNQNSKDVCIWSNSERVSDIDQYSCDKNRNWNPKDWALQMLFSPEAGLITMTSWTTWPSRHDLTRPRRGVFFLKVARP